MNGDKAWRKHAGNNTVELDADAVTNEKRSVYLQVIPGTILPLKTKAFKVETAGDETVAGNPAVVLKVTGPEGKSFTLAFDKQSGLPVKLQAKVFGFQEPSSLRRRRTASLPTSMALNDPQGSRPNATANPSAISR